MDASFALKGIFPGKDKVILEYYLPQGQGPFPAVIILPHLAGKSGLESFFAQGLVRKKIAVLTIGEPYFAVDRREGRWWMHEIQKEKDLIKIKKLFQQLVIDTRRGIDFLEDQPEIKNDSIGLLGLSLGGCLGVLVSGVDSRIKASAFLLSGGDLKNLVKESAYTELLRKHLYKADISYELLEKSWIEVEPLLLASYAGDRPTLMINATFDHLMPYSCSKKLWQALGNPRIIWIPSGHYGSVLFLNYARVEVFRFFIDNLRRE